MNPILYFCVSQNGRRCSAIRIAYCTHIVPANQAVPVHGMASIKGCVEMSVADAAPPAMTAEKLPPVEDLRQVMNGLLSTLSHDLRTPLSTITGWLFMLESDKLDAVAKKRALDKIRTNIADQVRLIDDVLLLSSSMTGHLHVDASPISPLAPLNGAMEKLRATAVAGSVDLPPATVSASGKIMADGELLRRVFEILLLHALKTTQQGGTIETAIGVRDGNVEITIADNGKGLSPAALPYLFDAFSKAENASGSAYPGAERNLMLARTLVEIQGGQLQASSRGPGLGTTFTLRMPCLDAQISAVNAADK